MTRDLPAHAVIRPLSFKDLDQVCQLEDEAFSAEEKMSRETALYRLKACPELTAGVFIRQFKPIEQPKEEPAAKGQEDSTNEHIEDRDEDYEDVDSDEDIDGDSSEFMGAGRLEALPSGTSRVESEKLIAQIVATKCLSEFVTDESMKKPDLDEYGRRVDAANDLRGHHEEGMTIAIHSVAVAKPYRGMSIGSILMRDYLQRMTSQHVGDRIALIAHDHLVPFYDSLGFINAGDSQCQHGGGNFKAMWSPIVDDEFEDE